MPSYILYKPFGMLSQFTREVPSHITLADLPHRFSKQVYPIGRLDADSEGLLLLSDDKSLNARLLHPRYKMPKTYYVQVEGAANEATVKSLVLGIAVRIKGKNYQLKAKDAQLLSNIPDLPPRNPPIRFRKSVPTTWLAITLTEGKNRQVRRMCAAVGFPVLRLVRVGIAGFWYNKGALKDLEPAQVREVSVVLPK